MNKKLSLTSLALALSVLITGCSSDEISPFTDGSTVSSTNIIYDNNFSIAADELNPQVIEVLVATTPDGNNEIAAGSIVSTWGPVAVEITATAGDRNNARVTTGTVFFGTEYGLLSSDRCTLDSTGTCSITWYSQNNIATLYNGATGRYDTITTVTAWTDGEESFVDYHAGAGNDDNNGNGIFDDNETFTDTVEPFIDGDLDGTFSSGDTQLKDTNSDGLHSAGDSEYNGSQCAHSTLCSSITTTPIQAQTYLDLMFETTP